MAVSNRFAVVGALPAERPSSLQKRLFKNLKIESFPLNKKRKVRDQFSCGLPFHSQCPFLFKLARCWNFEEVGILTLQQWQASPPLQGRGRDEVSPGRGVNVLSEGNRAEAWFSHMNGKSLPLHCDCSFPNPRCFSACELRIIKTP